MFPKSNQPEVAPLGRRRSHSAVADFARKSGSEISSQPFGSRRWIDDRRKSARQLIDESQDANSAAAQAVRNLPVEIGFLVHFGVAADVLAVAAARARAQGVKADAVLLAEGHVSEYHFYRSLARHLHLAFVDGRMAVAPETLYPQSIRAGLAPLADPDGPAFLAAPRGFAIAYLTAAMQRRAVSCNRVALTTPTRLSRLVRMASREKILREASLGLWSFDPALCARGGKSLRRRCGGLAIVTVIGFLSLLAPAATSTGCRLLLSLAFLAVIWLRLAASAAILNAPRPPLKYLQASELPLYSIVIALYREARVVPQLLAAMDAIDYPRAKLDVKIVVEEDDDETLAALGRANHRSSYEVLVAPAGMPRTKPRALDIALPLVRGQFIAVFDAEDVPDPWQIRMAAEHFAAAPAQLACLQAQLAIDNVGDTWLTRLFAIEYAALFDVINVGLAALRLPFPLGGSSNHFRTDVLRKLGGWDAWNVTEDADIGLRLARFGYYAETLHSTTFEEAPAKLAALFGQRRRWCKGWYQTLFVLYRDPGRLLSELGPARFTTTLLVLMSYVLAPLVGPLFALWLAVDIARCGLSVPRDLVGISSATLSTSVFVAGIPAILWPALQGMKRRGLLGLWPSLLLFPAYCLLICCAAWTGIYDLMKRPHHWHKTEHGLARSSRLRAAMGGRSLSGTVATSSAVANPRKADGQTCGVRLIYPDLGASFRTFLGSMPGHLRVRPKLARKPTHRMVN